MAKIQDFDRKAGLMKKVALVLCLSLASAGPVFAASFEPEWGRHGMVASSVGPAAAAGRQMLERGGNAFDAAIATAFAAAVVHPFSSGLGGGLFAVVHDSKSGQTRSLDARETAPASASAEFFRENPDSIRSGARSVGVPGFVQGVWALHQEYGSLPWKDLVEPAVLLAERGVKVSIWHRNIVARVLEALEQYPETKRVQTVDGQAPPLGWNFVQTDLAGTLRHIQEKGEKSLAIGPIAAAIEKATGGVVTELDLARFQPRWRDPVMGSYRDYRIAGMPPPSSGGVLLAQMLNILERYDLAALGKDSSDFIHLVTGAMIVAFEDRAQHLGDSDFWDVPIGRLVSREYADLQAARLRPDGLPLPRGEASQVPDDDGTTHISVLDRFGNAVALTQTINTIFGSKITVPGTGLVLNNEMDDFSVNPGVPNAWGSVGSEANAIEPGKRPLSSMTPALVFREGRPVMAVGGSMGTMIISSVLHTLINVIDFGFDAQRAVQAPRFHHQWKPDALRIEPEFPLDVRQRLEERGHVLQERTFIGAVQLSLFDPGTCMFFGGADGRRDSKAAGANIGAVARPSDAVACAEALRSETAVIPD